MAELLDRNALTEELTIQQVILQSLQDEDFDGVELERAEVRKTLEDLKARLERLDQERADGPGSGAPREHTPLPVRPGALPTSEVRSPHASTTSAAHTPTKWRHNASAFSTPRKREMSDDIWSSPAGRSLTNRKRGLESPSLGNVAKSRRTTPTPMTALEPDSPGSGVDIIDLTGDVVDFDATCIAEQIKQEKMQEQEMRDRDLALQLSGQASPRPSPLGDPTPDLGHTNAFSKLMASRGPNLHHAADNDLDWPPVPHAQGEGSSSHGPSLPANMPGAWVDDAQPDVTFRPAFSHSPASQAALATSRPSASVTTTPRPHPYYNSPLPPNTSFSTGALRQSPASGGPPPALLYPSMDSQAAGGYRTGLPPFLPGPGGMGLSDVLDKTGAFDYSSHVDAEGNALPERLSSFLEHAYHDPDVTAKELDDLLRNIRPDMDIPEKNRDGTPAGLKDKLYRHQELALSWMKNMEDGTNRGGILADDMGLGKTISTLALILAKPPRTGRSKTTLIIGPVSLMHQWQEEIRTKTKLSHRLSVFVYHNKRTSPEDLLRYDVVLTTYGTIAMELNRLDKFLKENQNRNINFNDRSQASKFPLLHPTRAEFYRVVLDEAQCIKNKKTKTAKACYNIRATYRWCLTGTPMMNGVLELFSLVHFLRIKPYCSWDQFRPAFGTLFGRRGDPKSVAMNRLRALLKAIMLRRKKDSQLDGKPILNLPPKTEAIVHATLSPDERGFYKQLEEKSQVQFSKYLREGSIGKNYSSILVLLLRMRQACCHPHLNLDVDDAVPVSDEDMIKVVESLSESVVARIKSIEAFECPICFDVVQSPSFFVPCGHDSCNDCLTRLLDSAAATNLRAGDESDRTKCPVCRGVFEVNKCFSYDAFRSVYMPETVVKHSASDAEDSDSDSDDDSESEGEPDDDVDARGNLRDFVVDDDDVDEDDEKEATSSTTARKARKKGKKGKKKQNDIKPSMLKTLRVEAAKNRGAYKRYMRYLRKTWMPSAKVTECMSLLKKMHEEKEKVIVFSQWTLLLDLLQVAMWHEGLGKPERYDGGMTGDERAAAAKRFCSRADVDVMLVSLRAGNAGLNLTAANNVVIMDPFWNPYIEMQAVDRAHRIGQKREVKVFRILSQETVEDRIVELQARKKEMVEAALDESESMKIGRLNVSELKFLFNARD